jgi:hypothetical protein
MRPTFTYRRDRDCEGGDKNVQSGHIRASDAIQFDSSVCRTLSFMISSPNPNRQAMSRRCRFAASVDSSDA